MAAGAPDWPERTADLSEIGIEVRFAPANTAGKLLSEISGSPATLTIRIVDYPGEWLLDLPLLGQSYRRVVARDAAALPRSGVRAEVGGEFLAFIAQHPRRARPRARRPRSRRTTSTAPSWSRRATAMA